MEMTVGANWTLSSLMAILVVFVRIADILQEHSGVFWTQRQAAQDFGDLQVALDLRRTFQVEPSDQALHVDHGGRLAVEGKDNIITLKCRMRAYLIRQDVHLYVR